MSVVTAAAAQKGFVIVTDANLASLTGTTSFITVTPSNLTDYTGQVDIAAGWSSNNAMSMTQTTVSHSGLFVRSFTPLYDGYILANINSVISGPKLGVNGILVSDNFGNSELFVETGSLTWPVQANVPYEFTVSTTNSRTGPNGLNVLMTADSSVEWVVVPEPACYVLLASAIFVGWLLARTR